MKKAFLFCILLIVLLPYGGRATDGAPNFPVPEKLEYELSWKGIGAGTSFLESRWVEDGVLYMTSTAVSGRKVSLFYEVNDLLESVYRMDVPWRAVRYHIKTEEGKHDKDREVFYYPDNTAVRLDWERMHLKMYEVPRDVHDPLSIIYYLRTLDLEPGETVTIPIFDSRDLFDGRIEVIGVEQVKVPAGKFEAVQVRFRLISLDPDEPYEGSGDFDAWFTTDARRIPVKIRTKARVGSLDAELKGIH